MSLRITDIPSEDTSCDGENCSVDSWAVVLFYGNEVSLCQDHLAECRKTQRERDDRMLETLHEERRQRAFAFACGLCGEVTCACS